MKSFFILCFICFFAVFARAQNPNEAHAYLQELTEDSDAIAKSMLRYASASVHSRRPEAVERKRLKLVRVMEDARDRVKAMPSFEGNFDLRNALYQYYATNYRTMNIDYAAINKMGETAESSFELMEKYIRADEEANAKVDAAYDELIIARNTFADAQNITIQQSNNALTLGLQKANNLNAYYNNAFLLFFKPFKEDTYLAEAVQAYDVAKIKVHAANLKKYTEEAMLNIDALPTFDGDAAMIDVSKSVLQFFLDDAENYAPKAVAFIEGQQEFAKLQAKMDEKKRKDLSQKEVNAFNKTVDKMNKAVNEFNDLSQRYFQMRGQRIHQFNQMGNEFRIRHMPVYGSDNDDEFLVS